MSDVLNKQNLSAFEIFNQTKITFEEAEEQAKALAGRPKVDRFRISDDGTYSVRVFPLAPNFDAEGNMLPMERRGFDYAVHQQFLSIELPKKAKDKKAKTINIPVVCATDKEVGKSIDLIDTYVKIAKEMYGDDDDLMELLNNSNYYGGLKWSYQHAIYVLDLTEKGKRKGPMLWQCSHAQYMQLYGAKQRLWNEEREDDPNRDCPVCGLKDAYPVQITRKTGKKTEYTIEMGRKRDDFSEDELTALLDLPRIPEQLYRFSLYTLEAEVVFLQQYDEKHDMEVTKEPDFKEAVERLKAELPADDTRHFDLTKIGDDKGDGKGGKEEITVNSLWAELDAIEDAGLSEKSDEYQELREKIRQFVEDKDLDVRLTRTKSNAKLLEEIEDALESAPVKTAEPEPEPEPEPEKEQPRQRRSRRPAEEEKAEEAPADDDKDDDNDEQPEPEPEKEQPRRRRARPGSAADKEEKAEENKAEEQPAAEEKKDDDEERPSRLHARRRR